MPLQSSGTIRMSQINTELGRSSTATISLDAAENGSYGAINQNSTSRPSGTNPAAMSEWYSYNHSAAAATTSVDVVLTGGSGIDIWFEFRNSNTNALLLSGYNPGFGTNGFNNPAISANIPVYFQVGSYYFGSAFMNVSVFQGSTEIYYQETFSEPPYQFVSFVTTSEPIIIYASTYF